MEIPIRRSVFKNPLALIGLVLVVGSFVGLILAVGNLVSLQYTPDKLVQKLYEQYASILAQSDVPTEVVERIQKGDLIPETIRSELSNDQARTLKTVEDHLPRLINAVSEATEISRGKSHFAIGLFVVLLVVGAVFTAIGFRSRKTAASKEAT